MSAGLSAPPLIDVVVGGRQARERLVADVARRFGADYEVVGEPSGQAALASLGRRLSGRDVAVVIAFLRLPEMTGAEFLGRVSGLAPGARRGLIVTYGDPEANDSVIEATTFGQIDQWCWEPWEPAEELLFPFVSALLTAWARGREVPRFEAISVVGEQWSEHSYELRDLLQRNSVPYGFYTPDSDRGRELLAGAGLDGSRLPVARLFDGRVLVEPSNVEVASALGAKVRPDQDKLGSRRRGGGPCRTRGCPVWRVGGASDRTPRRGGPRRASRHQHHDPQLSRLPTGDQRERPRPVRCTAGHAVGSDLRLCARRRAAARVGWALACSRRPDPGEGKGSRSRHGG